MLELSDAWRRLDEHAQSLPSIECDLEAAHGMRLSSDVVSCLQLPPFDNSAMDGYAVRSADCASATEDEPVSLRVVDDTFAGDGPAGDVQPGTAVRIMTGAPTPPGADAVVRLEDARLRDEVVWLRSPVAPGRHIRNAAEDVSVGEVIASAGSIVSTGAVGLLSSCGVDVVTVTRRPTLAIRITGSELVQPGGSLGPGEIHDANGPVLRDLARRGSYDVSSSAVIGDDRDSISGSLDAATAEADVVIVSGGVSVGRRDYVKRVLLDLGAEVIFWRVKMKPGKPLLSARMPNGCLVFGLPGNPVSALAGWSLFVLPTLQRLAGDGAPLRPVPTAARLTRDISGDAERTRFATGHRRVSDDGVIEVTPTPTQGSAMMRSMAAGTCFIELAPGAELHAGDVVPTYGFSGSVLA